MPGVGRSRDEQDALDGVVHRLLPTTLTIAGVVVALFALLDPFIAPGRAGVILAVLNAVPAALYLFVAWSARTNRIPARHAQLAFLIAQGATVPSLVAGSLALPGQQNAYYVALNALGSGAVLLSWRHYLAQLFVLAVCAAALGAAGALAPSPVVSVAIVAPALALGCVIHLARLRGHRELARLTVAERERRERLEEAHAALRASEERFEHVLASIPEAFWIQDTRSGRLAYVSPAFETIWGTSRDAFTRDPRAWARSVHADDLPAATAALDRISERGEGDHEYRIVRPDGSVRWIRDRVFAVKDAAGASVGMAGIAEDVTMKREVEATLRRSERLSTLGTLVAGVAHEINNPLTYIRANVDLAEESINDALARSDLPEVARAPLAEARDSARVTREGIARIAHITASLKRVARAGDSTRAIEDPNALLESALVVAGPRVRGGTVIERDLRATQRVRVSGTEITQVLLNLLLNAVDALEGQGGTIRVSSRDEGRRVVLEVADTGPGMTQAVIAKLFTPFYTTKSTGTGLGLSIAHGIVAEHGGDVTVESSPGAGTRFCVTLPAA